MLKIEVELGPHTRGLLQGQVIATTNIVLAIQNLLVPALNNIASKLEPKVTTIYLNKINFNLPGPKGENMYFSYEADKADFSVTAALAGADSEGDVISDAPIPAGVTLIAETDAPGALSVAIDPATPKTVNFHVGSPNPDGSPAPVNLSVRLVKDDDGTDFLPPLTFSGEVKVGLVKTITGIAFPLPAN